jgi:rubrerythrin
MTSDAAERILNFAIANEQRAAEFYTELANKASNPNMKDAFLNFAEEEKGHLAKLQEVKAGKRLLAAESNIVNLGLAEQIDDQAAKVSDDMDYQQALVVAMKAEKAAFRLYTGLAVACDDLALKEMLLGLAQEEARHKLRFEIEYDDHILKEN